MINQAVEFLLHHGYGVLFAFVFAEQIGLPVPALPVLLAVGALAASDQFVFAAALAAAAIAAVLSDLVWYELGRFRGHAVLSLVCKISLEPDSCVRNTHEMFTRHGLRTLLFSKFVPGLNTVAPPLAGMARVPLWRFLFWDGAGALIWAGVFLGSGHLFSAQLEVIAEWALRFGSMLLAVLALGLAAYITMKYLQRRSFFRRMRVARISPEELAQRLDAREPVIVIDLRHSHELEIDRVRVPGALQLRPDELEQRHLEIPREREIILYCT